MQLKELTLTLTSLLIVYMKLGWNMESLEMADKSSEYLSTQSFLK